MRLRDLATYHYKVVQGQRGGGSGAGWDEEGSNSGVRDWEGGAVERTKATPHAEERWRQRLLLSLYVLKRLGATGHPPYWTSEGRGAAKAPVTCATR